MRIPGLLALVWALGVSAQTPPAPATPPASSKPSPPQAGPRTSLGATALRNENVAVWQIDNNAVKEANIRVGTRATVSDFTSIESQYFATEHGQAPSETLVLPSTSARPGWHGELFENLQNSIF